MKNIEFSNCMQVIGIFGILPNRVCGRARSNKLMDLQISNNFPSETEGAESEEVDISETEGAESEEGDISMDLQISNNFPSETESDESEEGDISMDLQFSNNFPSETRATEAVLFWGDGFDGFDSCIGFWGTEMLKWFNHQSVDNSIFFSVGRNFPKLVVCIAGHFDGFVKISINGYENREYQSIRLSRIHTQYLFSLTQWSLLQRHLNESNPTDQNRVKVSIRYKSDDTCYPIRMWGVHVECTCPPQEDDAVDYGYSIKGWGSKKQRTR